MNLEYKWKTVEDFLNQENILLDKVEHLSLASCYWLSGRMFFLYLWLWAEKENLYIK